MVQEARAIGEKVDSLRVVLKVGSSEGSKRLGVKSLLDS